MGEMHKFRVGDTLEGIPVDTLNAHTDAVLAQRTRIGTLPDERKPKQKSPVHCQIAWGGATDIDAGNVVKITGVVYEPATYDWAPYQGISFLADEFGSGDADEPYAILLAPATAIAGSVRDTVAAVMPECYWAKVDVSDAAHTHATIPATGVLFTSGTAGLRIIWKETGTGEKWAVVQIASSGTSAETCLLKATAAIPAASGTPRAAGTSADYDVILGSDPAADIQNWSLVEITSGSYMFVIKIGSDPVIVSAFC